MRTTTRTSLTLATLIGIAAAPALGTPASARAVEQQTSPTSQQATTAAAARSTATAPSTTTRERGVVIECTGTYRGKDVRTVVYENNAYTNHVEVVLGDPDAGGVWKSRDTQQDLWSRGQVAAGVRLPDGRATVTGTAVKVGRERPVHEVHDDAGQHIVVDGVHRRLRTDLVLTYRHRTAPLTCTDAFHYDLQVTKTPIG